ncbi:MAG: hypothetical protein WCQ54_02450 [Clostridiaceae bacterium]
MKKACFNKILILLICTAICLTASCSSNDKSIDMNSYLTKNHAEINIHDCSGFNLLDKDITKSDVILTGEAHAISKNYQVKLSMIKYLNEKYKLKYLLEEIGYSQSCFINQYLKTGDESKLKLVFNNLKGTAAWSKEYYDFFIKLREYNLTLPESERIIAIGIDIEHQIGTALIYLNSILPESEPIHEIKPYITDFKDGYKKKNTNAVIKAAVNLQNNIKADSRDYEKYLGDKYFDFSIVLDNIINSKNAYASNSVNFESIREPGIYSNFKRIYSNLPKGKYFGEFGMEHVYQNICNSYMGDKSRFAMYLNSSDSPIKGKVLSIAYAYQNCKMMTWGKTYGEGNADSGLNDIDILNNISKSDITLFKLNGDRTPFSKKIYFVETKKSDKTDTDYFKYIILIKNSKGTIPYDNSQ